MNITQIHTTRDEAVTRLIVEAIDASGEATSAEYDIEAIADAVLDTDDRGRWGMSDDYVDADGYGDAEAFWAVVEHHAR